MYELFTFVISDMILKTCNIIKFLLVSTLLYIQALGYSQKQLFFHLGVEDGLPNGVINCIAQDKTGFIWIGTNDGLIRYDGKYFKNFSYIPGDSTSLINNTIQDILCEGYNVWICTNKGVDRYNSKTERFSHIPILDDGLKQSYAAFKIFKDLKGHLLIATQMGLYIYDEFEHAIKPSEVEFGRKPIEISSISQDRDNDYWIGSRNYGVFTFNSKSKVAKPVVYMLNGKNALQNNKIFCLYEDNQHTVWIGTEEGLFSINKDTWQMERYVPVAGRNDALPHISVNKIVEDSRNNLWIGTNGGLAKFNRKDKRFINYYHDDNDPNSLTDNSIHSIFEDAQNNLWIGSGESGLNISRLHDIEFNNFVRKPNDPLSLSYAFVSSVLEDSQGNIWVGTNGKGINKYDAKTMRFQYFIPPSSNQVGTQTAAILSLIEDRNKNIWIGSYLGGLTVYNPKTQQYKTFEVNPADSGALNNNIVNCILEDSKGNIWVATNGGGVNIYQPATQKFKHIRTGNSALSSDYCLVVKEDAQSNIWVGSYYGLNKIDTKTLKVTRFVNSSSPGAISADVIYSIYTDAKGRIWVGTNYGLNLYNPVNNTFTVFTTQNGLPNNVINGILGDNRGFIWLSTNRGLCKFDPENFRVVNYDKQDGIASLEFFHGACFKSKKGMLYFGGIRGLTFFNPDIIKTSSARMPLVLTELLVFNQVVKPGKNSILDKSITYTDEVKLKYNQSFITIGFAALNFSTSSKDNYSYYLDGIDRQWNNVGNNRYASYTNLPAGNYTFYVKSFNNAGLENQVSLKIIVKPAFYKTTFAYILYILLFIGLSYFTYSYIHSRTVYKHNLLIERMEKEKAVEINQAKIKFFINVAHEFKTPLTLIVSPVEKLLSSAKSLSFSEINHLHLVIYRNSMRLSRLMNQIMDLRRIDTGNIKLYVTEKEIVSFVREITLSFEDYAEKHNIKFSFESNVEHLNVWFDADKLEKVIYNLISNAFRYTPDGHSVKIIVEHAQPEGNTEGIVRIIVEDKGIGIKKEHQKEIFNRFFQVPSEYSANPASSGIGLSIANEFIEMHHGHIAVDSEPGQGSTFTVTLPLGNKHFDKEEIIIANESSELYNPEFVVSETVEDEEANESENSLPAAGSASKRKFKLMIAEDNYELRNFLATSLSDTYTIFEAANGKEGLDLVNDHMPDIVITDVMMPVMNGIELCKAIKTNIKTSHIPVVILTVLNNYDNQLEGLETGADDYITKPFNISLLRARLINLIENRKKLIKRFVDEMKPEPDKLAQNSLDSKFLTKAFEIVEKNLTNTEFSAEDFASQIGMSRSNLHIKLKALTNQSATEFIRLYRLKKAAELLSNSQYNISEVSFMVGFNSISYFNRCFKLQFGLTPTEFMEKGPTS
ncbi:MAG TPA: two-component regulator propeller domain-containing protein [Bacteroidales bacterium]|nr:two-component regulator propeller domain-containing protein [Bacteroidales bacterium]